MLAEAIQDLGLCVEQAYCPLQDKWVRGFRLEVLDGTRGMSRPIPILSPVGVPKFPVSQVSGDFVAPACPQVPPSHSPSTAADRALF